MLKLEIKELLYGEAYHNLDDAIYKSPEIEGDGKYWALDAGIREVFEDLDGWDVEQFLQNL